MMVWVIYALICPINLSVRYIGITSGNLQRRLQFHLCGKGYNPDKYQWIIVLGSQGLRPSIVSIDSTIGTRAKAEQLEQYWIYEYIKAGHDLLNIKHIPGSREHFFEFLRNQPKCL